MKRFKSKFGTETMVFLTLLFGGIIAFMVYQKVSFNEILSVGGIFLLTYGFVLYLNFSTYYTVTEEGVLIVKCGFLYHKNFDINKIQSVRKTNNLISSPAPSLDRIEVSFGRFDNIIISPKDKNDFANELIKVNPRIENKISE